MKRKLLSLIILTLIFSTFTLTTQAQGFTVSNASELINAINTANINGQDDVITFTSDITLTTLNNTTNGLNGLPIILDDGGRTITIKGSGFTLNRAGTAPNFRLFHVITGGTLAINNLTIQNGNALDGGGIYNLGNLRISYSQIINNTATNGGGISSVNDTIQISNSIISGNTASNSGGGIYLSNSITSIENTTISNNMAGVDGGGIYTNPDGQSTFANVTISENQATRDGGGFYSINALNVLTNVTVSDNQAGVDGGGIYIYANSSSLYNTTISGNRANILGGGLYVRDATAFLRNNIISGNTIAPATPDCYFIGSTTTATNNIFGVNNDAGGCPSGGTNIVPSAGVLIADILLPLANNGGVTRTHALVAGSPAIDASGVGSTPNDQRGATTVGTRDSGAFEYTGVVPTITVGIVSASSILENGGTAIIPVTLANNSPNNPLIIEVSVVGGDAIRDIDYTVSPPLTMNSNGTQNFTITALTDALVEGNETLTVSFNLFGAATIVGNGNQTVTITNVSPPTFNQAFAPDTIAVGATSTLTFTIDNTANTTSATALDFTNNLPAGIIIATPANASTTCTGGTISAVDGSSTLSYTSGTVDAEATCTVQVDVVGQTAGTLSNTSGDLSSSFGNSGTASANLTVNLVEFNNVFTPNVIAVGENSTLTLTIDNTANTLSATALSFADNNSTTFSKIFIPDNIAMGNTATALDFTDTLPAGVIIATPVNASTTCTGGTLTAIGGSNTLSYTGGTVGAGKICTIQIEVTGIAVGTNADLIVTEAVTDNTDSTTSTGSNEPNIEVFDPAISKIGLLVPGQTGGVGEQLEWIVTVSNTGNAVGNNVVVTDTLIDALQVDSINAPGGITNINGQIATVTYPIINVGETFQFSIFTTVLEGVTLSNTVCINADNQGAEECVAAPALAPITQLPETGETPFWRMGLIGLLALLGVLSLLILKQLYKPQT